MMLEILIWIFNFQQEQSIQQKHGSAQTWNWRVLLASSSMPICISKIKSTYLLTFNERKRKPNARMQLIEIVKLAATDKIPVAHS